MANSTFKRRLLQATALVVLVLAVYQPSLHNGFIWDDDAYVHQNLTLTSLDGLKRIWLSRSATPQYYPMVFSSFWVEYQIFGPEPMVFHLTNMMLHGINAILVWLILMRLGLPWAWLAAAVFALHPVNVESVAWISERKNVLSGLFALSSLLLLVRLYLTDTDKTVQTPPSPKKNAYALYGASFFLFILALLSKSVTCMMPVVFLVLVWWKRGKTPLGTIGATVPFFIAGIVAGINTSLVEKLHVGAQGADWEFNLLERMLIAGRALWFYAYKLIWPSEIMFTYPRWEIDSTAGWQYLFPAAVILLFAILFAAKNRVGRGPVAGVAIFAVTLFPALGFISYFPMLFSFVADHFQYLATIALITLVIQGLHRMTSTGRRRARTLAMGFCTLTLLALGVRTWQEQDKYKNLQALWEDTIRKNPDCYLALNNLGCVLMSQPDKLGQAYDIFAATLKMGLDYPETRFNLARTLFYKGDHEAAIRYYTDLLENSPEISPKLLVDVHYDMAMILVHRDQIEAAETHLRAALELKPFFPEGYNDLGVLLRRAEQFDKAIDAFSEALAMKPDYAEARYNLAQVLYDSGQAEKAMVHYNFLVHDETTGPDLLASIHNDLGVIYTRRHELEVAKDHLSRALCLAPDSPMFHNNLGLLMIKAGRKSTALESFSRAVVLDPDYAEARYQLALLSAETGDTAAAVSHYNYILSNAPAADNVNLLADVYNGMGNIYAEQNQTKKAIYYFKHALALKPDFAEVHNNMALTLLSLNRRQKAIDHFTRALAIQPGFTEAANSLVLTYSAAGAYDKALTVLKNLLAAAPDSAASISYNIACIHSIRGDLENAATWLNRAIDRGLRLQRLLETDPDLENIRKSQYYPGLLERMQKSTEK
ncbi:tetratricopeptide repeat protein [Desulfosudis oleivorans]|uniref:TPR repeat-containing protein n=1 Tax=Desulfosudis oleivorans (strain DSM 6200 / JCM 39069 / Hxd3) TaxID=96561 RepID=A8ZY72_DESOH|nr:tetratricopeptide repeat protein [Desulfosudis oleivorans]ABW67079.1 TPR repeat-containing protein [Desulfosudis oleivorans Hxd3]